MAQKDKITLHPDNIQVEMGSHVLLMYRDPSELEEFLVQFFHEGLKGDNVCIYVNDASLFSDVKSKVQQKGTYNEDIINDSLKCIDYKEFYFVENQFRSSEVFKKIDVLLDTYVSKTVRALGSDSWVNSMTFDDFHKYELDLSKKYNNKNLVIVCAYSLKQFDAEQIIKLTQSHSLILYKDKKGLWTMSETIEKKIYGNKIEELEKFASVAVGRELKMIELKKKIEALENEIKKAKSTNATN